MINYPEKNPDNVDLGRDECTNKLSAGALGIPRIWAVCMTWGRTMTHNYECTCERQPSVNSDGWRAVRLCERPDYRFCIFLHPLRRETEFYVNFEFPNDRLLQEVPGEYRSTLRRVTSGGRRCGSHISTEPASLEAARSGVFLSVDVTICEITFP